MSLEPPTHSEPASEAENAVPFPASAAELRTPTEWSALDGVTVMDPDGWRGCRDLPAKSWDESISREEWEQRLSISTHSLLVARPKIEALSVVDRVALRLFAIKSVVDDTKARKWWAHALNEEDREAWRRHARALLADIALGDEPVDDSAATSLPRDWRAVHIPPNTPFWDEPGETQPPGWFVFGGFSADPEEGAAFVLGVEQALDRDETGMSLEGLANAVAGRLNGGASA